MTTIKDFKVIKVNDKIDFCNQSEFSDGELDLLIEAEGKRYDVIIEGRQTITTLREYNDGTWDTPCSPPDTRTDIEMKDYYVYYDEEHIPLFNTPFTEEYLESLLNQYLG